MRGNNFLATLVGNQIANQFLMLSGQANDAQIQQAAITMGQQYANHSLQFSMQLENEHQRYQELINIIQKCKDGEIDLKNLKVSQDGVEILSGRPSRNKKEEEVDA